MIMSLVVSSDQEIHNISCKDQQIYLVPSIK